MTYSKLRLQASFWGSSTYADVIEISNFLRKQCPGAKVKEWRFVGCCNRIVGFQFETLLVTLLRTETQTRYEFPSGLHWNQTAVINIGLVRLSPRH